MGCPNWSVCGRVVTVRLLRCFGCFICLFCFLPPPQVREHVGGPHVVRHHAFGVRVPRFVRVVCSAEMVLRTHACLVSPETSHAVQARRAMVGQDSRLRLHKDLERRATVGDTTMDMAMDTGTGTDTAMGTDMAVVGTMTGWTAHGLDYSSATRLRGARQVKRKHAEPCKSRRCRCRWWRPFKSRRRRSTRPGPCWSAGATTASCACTPLGLASCFRCGSVSCRVASCAELRLAML